MVRNTDGRPHSRGSVTVSIQASRFASSQKIPQIPSISEIIILSKFIHKTKKMESIVAMINNLNFGERGNSTHSRGLEYTQVI